ncbi:MAG: hypothetical protein H6Q30_373 [Bacteroidetes bacterium]|jgi:hypothetical protein|nr:hypothetical protein [Bacteroidota bacterium]
MRARALAVLLLACFQASVAQDDEFIHPELEWKTIETAHFFVHYHEGAERTGRTIAKIAEEVYGPITSFYGHEPDQKVNFVVTDHDDISNGGAYFYENKIEIFAPSLDYVLRGTHNWLRDVVSHEFTHIVQIQTAMKFGRKLPAFYFQWLGYESERRPDVLYGYPDVIVSYPWSGFAVPVWFAEGVAQYNRKEFRYDFWDSHRDMILRSYALDGNMLTWDQMGVFGKTSLGNESSYNAGFALVDYIARTYGEAKLTEISRNLADVGGLTVDNAIEQAVGKPGKQVYDEWRQSVEKDYAERVAPIRANLREGAPFLEDSTEESLAPAKIKQSGTIFAPGMRGLPPGAMGDACFPAKPSTGFANMYPAYSPDGSKVAYVSAKGGDYFGLASLYVYDFGTKKETLVQSLVRTAFSWSPDGKELYYAKSTRDNPNWNLQFDIYRYTLETEEEERVTRGRRALDPAVSPDGTKLAFVVNGDGTTNLAMTAIDGSGYRVVTPYVNGEQVYSPQWSPSGDRIIFDYSIKDGRDIASVRPDGTDLKMLMSGPDDTRGGVFTPDGSRILFSSDRTGIFNLASFDIATGEIAQVTNVLGGAFFPTVNAGGDIIYSSYTSAGYKLVRMEKPEVMPAGKFDYIMAAHPGGEEAGKMLAMASAGDPPASQFNWEALRSYDDTQLPEVTAKPYRSIFSSLMFVPFLRVDNYNPSSTGLDMLKPGLYVFSDEVLRKTGFFAGIALNRKLERDLFLQFFYRGRIPILYQLGFTPVASLELYNVTRKTTGKVTLPDRDPFDVDISYNLLEFDIALNESFASQFTNVELRYAHSRYTSEIGSFALVNNARSDLVASSSDLYLIANTLALEFRTRAIFPASTMEINPIGRKVSLKFTQEFNQYNGAGNYEISSTGLLRPVYEPVNFLRVELNWREYLPFFFKNHTLTTWVRGGTTIGPPVDEFFNLYAGGLVGMKGYSYYSLGGNELAALGLAYRFPIASSMDFRLLHIYFDKLYASVYGDIGNTMTAGASNAWEKYPGEKKLKTNAGMELRLESFSYYALPTRVFFNAVYGFTEFKRYLPNGLPPVIYGKEWRFYFGVLFGFDLD